MERILGPNMHPELILTYSMAEYTLLECNDIKYTQGHIAECTTCSHLGTWLPGAQQDHKACGARGHLPQQFLSPSCHPVQGDLLDSHTPGHRHGVRPRRRHVPVCEEEQRLEGGPLLNIQTSLVIATLFVQLLYRGGTS